MKAKGKDIRSLVQDGDSIAVTIPPDFLEINNLRLGDYVEVIYGDILIIKPISKEEIERELKENSTSLQEVKAEEVEKDGQPSA